MIDHRDLQTLASDLLLPPQVTEVAVRRAVSAAYYGLFHRLTATAADQFASGGPALAAQVARAFSHTGMRKVCDDYVRRPAQPFPVTLGALNASAVETRVVQVAQAFSRLQEARHDVDYDVTASFDQTFGLEMLRLADFAHLRLDEVEGLPQTTVFLTALLLGDRWTRRG